MSLRIFSADWLKKLTKSGSSCSIGDVRHSMLTLAQFQQENGSTWVLCDGSDITGSQLATLTGNATLPDARGQFLRGKNNGRSDGQENPDGDVAIGAAQLDELKSHTHAMRFYDSGTGGGPSGVKNDGPFADHGYMSSAGGNETRPKNITVNIFIKIN